MFRVPVLRWSLPRLAKKIRPFFGWTDVIERSPRPPLFSVNPLFDDLRDDPRFQDLLHRIALAKTD